MKAIINMYCLQFFCLIWNFSNFVNSATTNQKICDLQKGDKDSYQLNIMLSKITTRIIDNCDELPKKVTGKFIIHLKGSLQILPRDFFHRVEYTTEFYATNVGLKEIKPGIFRKLERLQVVDLQGNNLETIPSEVFISAYITTVDLSNNSISELDDAFVAFSVATLDLSDNELTEIKYDAFHNFKVDTLWLSNNKISTIEDNAFDTISALLSLGTIDVYLDNNRIETINPEVFDNEYFRLLNLENNSISVLRPKDLEGLSSLTYLNLGHNLLKQIPENVFNYTSIIELNLSHNEISFIADEAFDEMENLTSFLINHNKIKVWNKKWFRKSWSNDSLKYLDFAANQLEEIPEEAFVNFPRPHFNLYFDNNKINKIADSAFKGWNYIETFSLAGNEIEGLSAELFQDIDEVNFLDLSFTGVKCPKDLSEKREIAPKAVHIILRHCPDVEQ